MSEKKKVRHNFRDSVFKRDGHKCRVCGISEEKLVSDGHNLDAHHITDRRCMPNGGYVPENGISLCPDCHVKAEHFHQTGESINRYSPEELYTLIGSSLELALNESRR